jgi:DNA-binding beta-propeller fold protein YncE
MNAVGSLALAVALVAPWLGHAAEGPLRAHPPIEIPESRGNFTSLAVDDEKRRLLLAHTGNGTLDVVDLNTEKLLKQIKTGSAVGVAVDAKRNRYYVSVDREEKLVFIDRENLEVVAELSLPGPADALVPGPAGVNRLFVCRQDGEQLWVIDPEARKIVSTLPVPFGPRAIAAEDATSRIYVSTTTDDSIQVISAADNNSTIGGAWLTTPARKARAMALDARGKRLFVAGVNGRLAVLNSDDGKLLHSLNLATGVEKVAFDPGKERLYCPSASGRMTVFDTSNSAVRPIGDVATANGAKSVAVDLKTHAVWVGYYEAGKCYARKFTP